MKIKLREIFEKQIELDKIIHMNFKVSYEEIIEKLKLALLVELSELANEIRCFKFWSKKDRNIDEIVLDEYVDVIHFITSISIYYNSNFYFEIEDGIKKINDKDELTSIFISLINLTSNLNNKKLIKQWYTNFLKFGYQLGYSIEEIEKAYWEKNKVNHERQKTNY